MRRSNQCMEVDGLQFTVESRPSPNQSAIRVPWSQFGRDCRTMASILSAYLCTLLRLSVICFLLAANPYVRHRAPLGMRLLRGLGSYGKVERWSSPSSFSLES